MIPIILITFKSAIIIIHSSVSVSTDLLSGSVLAQGLKSPQFKPLPRHPVVEVSSSVHLHLAPATHISIMLLRPAK